MSMLSKNVTNSGESRGGEGGRPHRDWQIYFRPYFVAADGEGTLTRCYLSSRNVSPMKLMGGLINYQKTGICMKLLLLLCSVYVRSKLPDLATWLI